jgi:hypothetical protein
MTGFAAYRQENVEVNLARATAVNITLAVAGSNAVVDVVASAEIDQSTNVQGSNISTEFFSNIPTSRTVQGLYTIAPTVARSGLRDASGRDRDPWVAGSSGPENSYILDGVNTTDPAFGGGGANLPFEFVQEVQIKTGAFGADQGLSTGGVFNVIPKTGTNEFHGDVFTYGLPHSFVRETEFSVHGSCPNGYSSSMRCRYRRTDRQKSSDVLRGIQSAVPHEQLSRPDPMKSKVRSKPVLLGQALVVDQQPNTLTFTTFGDFTKEEGFYAQNLQIVNGFGDKGASRVFVRPAVTTTRLVSTRISPELIGEFSFGIPANKIHSGDVAGYPACHRCFAILRPDNTVAPIAVRVCRGSREQVSSITHMFRAVRCSGISCRAHGSVSIRSVARSLGSSSISRTSSRSHMKYGFEFYRNSYDIFQASTGPNNVLQPGNVAQQQRYDSTTDNQRFPRDQQLRGLHRSRNGGSLSDQYGDHERAQSFAAQKSLAASRRSALPGGATSVTVGADG